MEKYSVGICLLYIQASLSLPKKNQCRVLEKRKRNWFSQGFASNWDKSIGIYVLTWKPRIALFRLQYLSIFFKRSTYGGRILSSPISETFYVLYIFVFPSYSAIIQVFSRFQPILEVDCFFVPIFYIGAFLFRRSTYCFPYFLHSRYSTVYLISFSAK